MPMNTQTPKPREPKNDIEKAWLLYSGIKSLLRCDEAETVRGIARYVVAQHRSLRVGAAFVEQRRDTVIPPVAAFLGAATRFLEAREIKGKTGAIWIARLDNERRAIENIIPLLPEINWNELQLKRPPDRAALLALPRKIVPLRRRIFKLTRLLLRRKHEFFKILRVVEMLGYYARYLDVFRQNDFRVAVVSSHSNPHGIAFNLAARKCGVPTILVTHGMPVRPVAKLCYDLGAVHCEAARRVYAAEGCRFKQVFIHGRRQDYAPMPPFLPSESLTVGIFLCKDVNEMRLRGLVEELLENRRVARVLIRPHPKNLFVEFEAWLASFNDARVRRSSGDSVFRDLEECDVVLGGNSSVLIEAVTAGRPGGYVRDLDYGSEDLHETVARGLVCPVDAEIDFDALLRFYQRAEWLDVLRLFAAIDEDETAVADRIAAVVRQLISLEQRPKNISST